ncbi:hypothetical protein EHQ43_05855 [Leptospira bouyouniensis]|uniref:Uncharacterized protein n=2 Tax=Leptospira bouyouniensis TaxID=2484911 RepID=A0A7I0IUV6_9LEPT|nr:hypothetical protein EHQ43_05855 [Leptospira bouyouniensis]
MENSMKSLTWMEFKKYLELYPELQLKFIYQNNQQIYPNYHITEFKLATIESVDCGGNLDTWKEIILQVLEPNENIETESMSLKKISNIYAKVSKAISIPENAILRIEFGNSSSAMRQYFVSDIKIEETNLVVYLIDGATECKASSKCGLPKLDKDIKQIANENLNIQLTSSSCCNTSGLKKEKESAGCC